MSNYTDISITLTGEEKNIKNFYEEIMKSYEDNSFEFYDSGICDVDIDIQSNTIDINGEGVNEPYESISQLAKEFELSGTYFEISSDSDFSHLIEYSQGNIINQEEDEYYSELSMRVKGLDYWLFLESSILDEEDWEEEYSQVVDFFEEFGGISPSELEDRLLD